MKLKSNQVLIPDVKSRIMNDGRLTVWIATHIIIFSEIVCVCVRERERKRERVCLSLSLCVCVCVCVFSRLH